MQPPEDKPKTRSVCRVSLELFLLFLLSLPFFPGITSSAPLEVGSDRKVVPYKLESVELTGTTRMTAAQLTRELGLLPGTPLDDDLVMTARTRLLGLGIFKSAILLMKKGSQKGLAVLIIDVEDDDSVLTDWALGTTLGVTQSDRYATTGSQEKGESQS